MTSVRLSIYRDLISEYLVTITIWVNMRIVYTLSIRAGNFSCFVIRIYLRQMYYNFGKELQLRKRVVNFERNSCVAFK